MKRFFISLGLLLTLAGNAVAQDARQRTPQTIVADVLAEMPYTQKADFDSAMSDLLSTGSFGVTQLAGMLVPADQGQNNRVEYALDGLVAYSSANADEEQLAETRQGLKKAIASATDNANKAFLMKLLSNISRPEDADVFVSALTDPYLSEYALSGLILTPDTDELSLGLISQATLPKTILARLAGAKHLVAAEPVMLGWLRDADAETATSVYKALALAGTAKSLPVLAKAAAVEKYEWLPTDATASYVSLLNRLATNPADAKAVAKDAGALMKKAKNINVRTGAMTALFEAEGAKALPVLLKAMSDPDRQFRMAALRSSECWNSDDAVVAVAALAKKDKTPDVVKTDIINWIGANKYASQVDAALANLDAADDELAQAAFTAASRIGGEEALSALVAHFDSKRDIKAMKALLSFNGDVKDAIMEALADDKSTNMRGCALTVACQRRIKEAAPVALSLLNDEKLSEIAYIALPGVVAPDNIGTLCQLLETSPASRRGTIQQALVAALRQLPAEEQYATLSPYFEKSAKPELYYGALATTGAPEAVDALLSAYKAPSTGKAAFEALLEIDSPRMIDVLYNIALGNDKSNNGAVLKRYVAMVDRYGKDNIDRYNHYRRGLEASGTDETDNLFIGKLASTGTYGALAIADARIANPATAAVSAAAIRSIMSKHVGEYRGEQARSSIVKATDYFKSRTNDPDAGYAVDDLKGILERFDADAATAATPSSKLTPEEEAMGFDLLFDGTSMAKWTGDTTTYIVRDGCITVGEARWGNNIYTADEYGDFIFRFEFSLDRPGVNNGVGIRTPMNVDAAFHGMEIQILDHDDPMYADIQPYQVHGSVYGVIPAERVKFKHGEWNTEEIRAEGDHITVTVNGKVILDGNIRDACQGHAVGDPGEEGNHYMIDHRNHPGLFNKRGHIGFLGHGAGIRFRNVRVLDLNSK
ncbi:MAG: DUF1080 domain-containing protein [Muribaculaceae bacterium]|nr:DUF1080 domain-containing protein [Muribaculaceae bacterium]